MNVIGYIRVSTEEQAASGLGLDAQRTAIRTEADRRGWTVTWHIDDGYSGSNLNRPAIRSALDTLSAGGAGALVVARLDRLSRSLQDFSNLTDRARREGWAVVTLDLGVDMTTPGGEMVANVVASTAQYERRLISQRTREALAALRQRGVRLGRPRETPAEVLTRVELLRADGHSLQAIADALTLAQVPCAQGGQRWYPSTVRGLLASARLDAEAAAAAST